MGHIITFAQQKGGAGKTTLLAHLAAFWSQEGKSVALFDLDPQKSLSRWAATRADARLNVIESRDYRAGSDLKAARKTHDLVLVDCPGAASSLLDNVIRESDLVIAPCQPSAMDIWASETILKSADREKTPCRILLNRVPPRFGDLDEVIEALGAGSERLMETRIGNRVAYSRSMKSGKTAQELARRSVAADEIRALAEAIAQELS